MDKNSALARLGLSGEEDAATVARVYSERTATIQGRLVSAQTDAEREQHRSDLSGLAEAFVALTSAGEHARTILEPPGATTLREAADAAADRMPDTVARVESGMLISSRLEIGEMLGQGGMGYVYAARDRLRDEDVAIKVLRQDLLFSSAAKERFLAEARVSSNLSHPNIVRVYDVGESGGHYYLSMERLRGQTLRQRIHAYQREQRAFTVAEVTDIARQLIDALRYAHRYIVHRDLKPENVWLSDDGTVKLMDFGIARAFTNSKMTQTGMTLGTAYYMAPEQRTDAKEVDWRADQYALGVVLYELLTGSVPMGATKPISNSRRDVPQRAANAIMRALSPKPEDRWPSLDAMLAELEPARKQSNKAAVWLIGLLLAGVAGAGVYYSTVLKSDQERTALPAPVATSTPIEAAPTEASADVPAANVEDLSAAIPDEPPSVGSPEPTQVAAVTKTEVAQSGTSTRADQSQASGAEVKSSNASMKTAALDPAAVRRQECIAQCERDDGECRSINRRGKQDCMRAVGFNSPGGFTTSPNNRVAECAFYTQARCRYAVDRDACLARIGSRYNECVNILTGSVASRRQDCDAKASEADGLCLSELRDCRSSCQ